MANGRYALIIASNRYTDKTLTQLKAPVIDAERLSKLLKDSYICGEYEVKILQDMQSNILRKEIERFFTKADKDDLRLIYFACHGVKPYYNFRLYLATEDSDLELLESTTIPAEFLVKQIQNSKASKIVVILDCCYSGSVSKEIRGGVLTSH